MIRSPAPWTRYSEVRALKAGLTTVVPTQLMPLDIALYRSTPDSLRGLVIAPAVPTESLHNHPKPIHPTSGATISLESNNR